MINEENLNKLYSSISEEKELTTKELKSYGFNSNDLNKLIQKGSIERIKRGLYSLKSADEVFDYGKKLIAEKKYSEANMYFEKCLELDPNYSNAYYRLLLTNIIAKNYNKLFELCEMLIQSQNKNYITDAKYYLYIFNFITELPEKQKEHIKNLKLEDITIPTSDNIYKNKIRIAIWQKQFAYASKLINNLKDENGKLPIMNLIDIILLNKVKHLEKKSRKLIINLIKDKKYSEIEEHLLDIQKKFNLNYYEKLELKLIRKLIEINSTLEIPEKPNINSPDFPKAIDNNDFNEALNLISKYNKVKNIENNKSIIYLLLNDICILIKSLSNDEPTCSQDIKKERNVDDERIAFIISSLKENDWDGAISNLRNYMKAIRKEKFEFLIVDLLKISLLDRDKTFSKPFSTLELLSKEEFSIKPSNYIQEFYSSLAQKKLDRAKIYFHIITEISKDTPNNYLINDLYRILKTSEKILATSKSEPNIAKTKEQYQVIIPSGAVAVEEKQQSSLSTNNDKGKINSEQEVITDNHNDQISESENLDYYNAFSHYGIENFDEINEYISESKLSIEQAVQQLNLSPEEMNIVKLIYAREYYRQRNFEQGDQLLKSFEKSKNRTKTTNKLCEEIRRNKRFYQNQPTTNSKKLTLSLKTKKYEKGTQN